MKNVVQAAVRWTLVVAYLALIFVLSSRQRLPVPAVAIPGFDKVVHCAVYAVLAVFIVRAASSTWGPERATRLWPLVAVTAFGLLYGITDEMHQGWIPGRTASGWDLVADAVGSAGGSFLGRLMVRSSGLLG